MDVLVRIKRLVIARQVEFTKERLDALERANAGKRKELRRRSEDVVRGGAANTK